MAEGGDAGEISVFVKEFECWIEGAPSDSIFLIEAQAKDDGSALMQLILDGEYDFKLHCPYGYPDYEDHFFVEAEPRVKMWGNALNEYLLDSPEKLSLRHILDKAVSLYSTEKKHHSSASDDGDVVMYEEAEDGEDQLGADHDEDEEDMTGGMSLSDDEAFTTEWELVLARKKKRWAQKEKEVRKEMKMLSHTGAPNSDLGTYAIGSQDKEAAKNIFTSSAAFGILFNDLVKIMEAGKSCDFTADPIEDNIYLWCVKLYHFEAESDLARDLSEIKKRHDYDYVELQLEFAIDLYPFYPPLVKVIRPRLQDSMMQRVTNMEMLKLSYWNPTKDIHSVLIDIKSFLQHWARLDVKNERNDRKRYPNGSYVDIDHHLLRLALVSEVSPRANMRFVMEMDHTANNLPLQTPPKKKQKEEYWAAGTGYGHHNRPEWDIKAYLAAQKEKDKQIENVLHSILIELKKLYANHAPQLKPRCSHQTEPPDGEVSEVVNPVDDMYNILEGSALIPLLEQYLKADSFLEICRHTSVYKVILDIIKEIAMQSQLVALLAALQGQSQSLYALLGTLNNKANMLLQHICKAGNGSIPKPPHQSRTWSQSASSTSKKMKESCLPLVECAPDPSSMMDNDGTDYLHSMTASAEEKLARDFQSMYKDVTEAFNRSGVNPQGSSGTPSDDTSNAEVMDISLYTDEVAALETQYKQVMSDLHFQSCDIEIDSHFFSKVFKKQESMTQSQLFRIAQELTSLSTSLPLDLSSAIFVRTDDEHITLMRALITGPEGTPYSGGCYQFDIYFPSTYPKVPPLVNLQTTGGGTVRFNPNLYNCGKVCLSLLGTWEGQQGEQWNETTSTVLQVLVSVQSLILVTDPYFNEPGYEQEIGTDAGRKRSADYNGDVRINNIKHGMISQLQNPSPGFEEVIHAHFFMKRDRLLQEVDSWLRTGKSSRLERTVANLKRELNKLQPPPQLNNFCNAAATASVSSAEGTPPSVHEEVKATNELEIEGFTV